MFTIGDEVYVAGYLGVFVVKSYDLRTDTYTVEDKVGAGPFRYAIVVPAVDLKPVPAPPTATAASWGYFPMTTVPMSVLKEKYEQITHIFAAPKKAKCTCGSHAVGSPSHSSWCDVKEIA
jgi:hypothetical protein